MGTILFILGVGLAFFFGVRFHALKKDWSDGVNGFSAFLSAAALLFGSYWYFLEGPGVPKLNINTNSTGWQTDEGELLLSFIVELENVGSTAISFDQKEEIELSIGQILPAKGEDMTKLRQFKGPLKDYEQPSFRVIHSHFWPPIAYIDKELKSEIEAGETDRFQFKALLPCETDSVLGITVKVPKKLDRMESLFRMQSTDKNLVWLSYSNIDAREICSNGEKN